MNMKLKTAKCSASTADTEQNPVIKWDSFQLCIEFSDYQNISWLLKFTEVSHFCLHSSDENLFSNTSDDGVYEVVDSELIKSLIKCGEIEESDDYNHWLIGFNEIGAFVEVVFNKYEESHT